VKKTTEDLKEQSKKKLDKKCVLVSRQQTSDRLGLTTQEAILRK
jgi:hypothetical protein